MPLSPTAAVPLVPPLLPPDAGCVPASPKKSGASSEQAASTIQNASARAPFRPALRLGELGGTMRPIMHENALPVVLKLDGSFRVVRVRFEASSHCEESSQPSALAAKMRVSQEKTRG